MNVRAQLDTVFKNSLDYSRKDYSKKDIYVSGAYFSGVFRFIPKDTTEDFNFYEGINSSLQIELKKNVAINFWYGFTPKFNYNDTWLNNKITILGSNINFPLYKYYKHFGFYMMGGISWKKITGYYTTSNNVFAQSKFQEYSPYIFKTLGAETGIGFEYKINYLQFYSLFKFRLNNSIKYAKGLYAPIYAPTTESFDFIIGIRLKIPKIFKNPKQRYTWF